MKVPDRWYNYKKSAKINGTRFIAFKVPLDKEFGEPLKNKRFTLKDLFLKHPDVKLVIDLTFTNKYYDNKRVFQENNVQHVKIKCQGRLIPKETNFKTFAEVVNHFIDNNPQNYMIGVHCTHGVNRTGYFIVRYMIEYLGYSPAKALNVFLKSRGHAIERTNYIGDLLKRKKLPKKS